MVNFKSVTKHWKLSALVAAGVLTATGLISLGESIKQQRVYQAEQKTRAVEAQEAQAVRARELAKFEDEAKLKAEVDAELAKLNREAAGEAQPEQSDPLAEWAVRQAEAQQAHQDRCWDLLESRGFGDASCY